MLAQGVIVPQEQVADQSFVVGAELNDAGETINPRLQFGLFALRPELREKLKGSRAGDVISLEEGKLKFKVLETYAIQQTPAPEAAPEAAPAADAPAAAEAAPAASDSAPVAAAPAAAPASDQVAPQA